MTDSVRLPTLRARRFVSAMSSFRDLRAPALLIDAASAQIQVALLGHDGALAWATSNDEAGIGIFTGVQQLGVDLAAVASFVFCEGPGSVLGIRTAAMAIRTWNVLRPRPIFAYGSLAVVAHALGREDVSVIADARRESWHCYQLGRGLRRVATSELSGALVMPDHFRHWSALPANVERVPYRLVDLWPKVASADLLHATDAPDAFLHEEPSYVMWTPQIHRAPTP